MIRFRASLFENFENLELAELDAPNDDLDVELLDAALEKSPLRAAKLLEGIFLLGQFDCDEFCEGFPKAMVYFKNDILVCANFAHTQFSTHIIPRTQIRKTAPAR